MIKADLQPFTHRIYMDFSGDDGDPGTPGSSKTICGAWILSSEEDIRHNEGVVLKIKKTIGCNKVDELKYRSIRRHPKKQEALDLLSELRVKVILSLVIKSQIHESDIKSPNTKRLLHLIHSFPLVTFRDYCSNNKINIYFQLVIDEMGWSGIYEGIREEIKKSIDGLDWDNARPDWLYFGKSEKSLMLQLADIFAGIGREYIEELDGTKFPPCRLCQNAGWNTCRLRRSKQGLGHNKAIKQIMPFWVRRRNGSYFGYGLTVRPPEIEKDYLFIECLHTK
jgi:hypothetical protein